MRFFESAGRGRGALEADRTPVILKAEADARTVPRRPIGGGGSGATGRPDRTGSRRPGAPRRQMSRSWLTVVEERPDIRIRDPSSPGMGQEAVDLATTGQRLPVTTSSTCGRRCGVGARLRATWFIVPMPMTFVCFGHECRRAAPFLDAMCQRPALPRRPSPPSCSTLAWSVPTTT